LADAAAFAEAGAVNANAQATAATPIHLIMINSCRLRSRSSRARESAGLMAENDDRPAAHGPVSQLR
jgi:hypothetical protein